ncbi:MAG: PEGA domain-containing protein [Methanomicrobiaceae archaeon]|nr:PEGA domain-containing protein [Methanomicrobiaceae archaeon]
MSQNCRIILAGLLLVLVAAPGALAGTTEVTLTRLAFDGETVLEQRTVDYAWMEAKLPVMGDGVTHYYHQGPVFVDDPDPAVEEQLRWNPEEDQNVLEKDYGAVKGTNAKDLCDLVGGMDEGDEVKFIAADGWSKWFAYQNVYEYSSREGPIVLTWWRPDQGYVSEGYAMGMRMVWFADDSTNPFGVHAFGVWDWHEAADEEYWYYYYGSPSEAYPTTTGLSGMYISEIIIYSDDAPTGSIAVSSSPGGARVLIDGDDSGSTTNCTVPDLETGMYSVSVEKEGYEIPEERNVEVELNVAFEVHFDLVPLKGSLTVASEPTGAAISLDGVDTGMETEATLEDIPAGEHTIVLHKEGYEDARESVMVVGEQDTEVFIELIPVAGDAGDAGGGDGGSSSGFTGKSLSQSLSASLNGTISVVRSAEDAVIMEEGDAAAYTLPVSIHAGTTPALGRLYLYATEGKGSSGKGLKPSFSVCFNGKEVHPVRSYSDIMGSMYTGSIASTSCYDVTSMLAESGDYTVDVVCTGPEGIECLVYGAALVGVFEGASQPSITYWIDEGCDVILSDPAEGTMPEECISTAPFTGVIVPSAIANATLTVVSTGPGYEEDDSHTFAMNGWEWANPLAGSGEGIGIFARDVKPHLLPSGNAAFVQSTDPSGALLEHRAAILVAEHASGPDTTVEGNSGIAPAATPPAAGSTGSPEGAGSVYALADARCAMNSTHLRLCAGNITLFIPRDARIVDARGHAVEQCTIEHSAPGRDGSYLLFAIGPNDAGSDTPMILAASPPDGSGAPSGRPPLAFAAHNASTGEWDLLPTFTDPESGLLYCRISGFGNFSLRAQVPPESVAPDSPTLIQSFVAFLKGILQLLFGETHAADPQAAPPFHLPVEGSVCTLSQIAPDRVEGAPAAPEGPFDLTIRSVPAGALIELNGTYTGRTTPSTFASFPEGSHDLRLVLDGFTTFEQQFQLTGDLVLCTELYPSGRAALEKLKFGTPGDWPDLIETGGVSVVSEPARAAIYIDGRDSGFVTPHVVAGLREGVHTIRVKKEGTSFASDSMAVWVYPGCLSACSLNAAELRLEKDITVVSDDFEGDPFTVDGAYRQYTIPKAHTITSSSPVVNVLDGDRFLSFSCLGVRDGSEIRVKGGETQFAGVMVESNPAGAEIFIDGFRTGICTPSLIDNVSEGYHHIAVSRPGFLPAGKKIHVIDDRLRDCDANVRFSLTPYPYGSLNITSSPPGAKIYLYDRYTGLTTPHTFTYMGIGRYRVRVLGDVASAERDDVVVHPYAVRHCHFDLAAGRRDRFPRPV